MSNSIEKKKTFLDEGGGKSEACAFVNTDITAIFISTLSGETFSENFSHTEKCQPCTQCTGLFRMETPCTDSNDAICVCNYGYYMSELSQMCEPCTKCTEGQGMLLHCEHDHDTFCEDCTGDTFSDSENYDNPCFPCTVCDEGEELEPCTPVSDRVCKGKMINLYAKTWADDIMWTWRVVRVMRVVLVLIYLT